MIFLPDTNAFSAYLAGRSMPLTKRMVAAFAAGELKFSMMVLAELEFGAEKARHQMGETKFIRRVEQLRNRSSRRRLAPRFPSTTRRFGSALKA